MGKKKEGISFPLSLLWNMVLETLCSGNVFLHQEQGNLLEFPRLRTLSPSTCDDTRRWLTTTAASSAGL